MKTLNAILLGAAIAWACQPPGKSAADLNPPCAGFDLAHSDPAAIELADSMMLAMGGRENWDNTRFISWNFNGRRNHVWDKLTGRIRLESLRDSIIYLANVNSAEGRVQIKGVELAEPDSLQKMLQRAKSMWINDSYWLVMPFKLKDTGVTLKYLGEDTLKNTRYNVLHLSFSNVGDTPENHYKIYVDIREKLVRHWTYFSNPSDTVGMTWPWDNQKQYGNILLSADRSDGRGPKDVKIDANLPDKVFTDF